MLTLSAYDLRGLYDWNAKTLVEVYGDSGTRTTVGYVFITTTEYRGTEHIHKLASGTVDAVIDPTPVHTAKRELEEECGIPLPLDAFEYIGKDLAPNSYNYHQHWKTLFRARCSLRDIHWAIGNHVGRDGEEPRYLTAERFCRCVQEGNFKYGDYGLLAHHGLITPCSGDIYALAL